MYVTVSDNHEDDSLEIPYKKKITSDELPADEKAYELCHSFIFNDFSLGSEVQLFDLNKANIPNTVALLQ